MLLNHKVLTGRIELIVELGFDLETVASGEGFLLFSDFLLAQALYHREQRFVLVFDVVDVDTVGSFLDVFDAAEQFLRGVGVRVVGIFGWPCMEKNKDKAFLVELCVGIIWNSNLAKNNPEKFLNSCHQKLNFSRPHISPGKLFSMMVIGTTEECPNPPDWCCSMLLLCGDGSGPAGFIDKGC